MPVVDLKVSAAVLEHLLCVQTGRFRLIGRDGVPLAGAELFTFQVEVDSAPRGARQIDPMIYVDPVTGRPVLTEVMWRDEDGRLLVTEEFDVDGRAIGGYFNRPLDVRLGEDSCTVLPPVVSFGCDCPMSRVEHAATPEQAWERHHTQKCTGPTQVVIKSWSGMTEQDITQALADALAALRPAVTVQEFTVEQYREAEGLPPLRTVDPTRLRGKHYELDQPQGDPDESADFRGATAFDGELVGTPPEDSCAS